MYSSSNINSNKSCEIKSFKNAYSWERKLNNVYNARLQPSRGASVDEYECVENETSYETTYYIVFFAFVQRSATIVYIRLYIYYAATSLNC